MYLYICIHIYTYVCNKEQTHLARLLCTDRVDAV